MDNIKLNFVHLCDNAFLSNEGKINIIGNFNIIGIKRTDDSLAHSFFVVTNFTVTSGKYEQEISLIRDEDNEVILNKKIQQEPFQKEDMGLILNLNVKFPSSGVYKVVIKINGKSYYERELIVKEVK